MTSRGSRRRTLHLLALPALFVAGVAASLGFAATSSNGRTCHPKKFCQPPDPGTTTAPTTTTGSTTTGSTTTTPTTTNPTTGAPTPLYSASSPWNSPVPSNPTVDPASAAMVQTIVAAAQAQGFLIAAKKWTWPLYYADSTTPRYAVSLTASWAPASTMSGVPIPANAAPDPSGDGHMLVIDRSTNCEYDFWQAVHNADGSWSASWANAAYATDSGWFDHGLSATGAGEAGGGGLIRPEELQAGQINHALVFVYPYTKAGGPVLPATESDGRSTIVGAIPEGAHLQLDPSLDLSGLGLNSYELVIAQALQRYGMFLGDSGGGVSLLAQHPQSTTLAYPWGDQTYVYLPQSLLGHLRVVELGAQYKSPLSLDPTGCATLK